MGKSKKSGRGPGRPATPQPRLRVILEGRPDPDYERLREEPIDAFAEAMADILIANARAEVAAELGIDPSALPGPSEGFPSIDDALDDRPRRR